MFFISSTFFTLFNFCLERFFHLWNEQASVTLATTLKFIIYI